MEMVEKKNNKRSQQRLMEGATFEDLKGNLSKQATNYIVTVNRP